MTVIGPVASRPASTDPTGLESIATLAHRLAVLLAAGVAPATAWRHAGGHDPPPWIVAVARAAETDPAAIADAILVAMAHPDGRGARRRPSGRRDHAARSALGALAAIWLVAAAAGAPLAPALRTAASALREAAASARAARIALAGPRATARLVVAMPGVAVVFGALLGFDTVGVLLGTPIGWACVVVGTTLMLAARAWSARLVVRASRHEPLPGLALELLAVAMAGGGSLRSATDLVDAAMRHAGLHGSTEQAAEVVELAMTVGAPLGELLRAEAGELRRRSAAAAAEAAAALESSLMVPLGVCVLPAFVVLGVVPLLVAVMSSTVAIL